METKKTRKQITFDIDLELHGEVKALAARRHISLNLWMMRAIYDRIKKEQKYDTEEEL